jgi:uncharacterized lipoprotein YddW (UPF0748 family)
MFCKFTGLTAWAGCFTLGLFALNTAGAAASDGNPEAKAAESREEMRGAWVWSSAVVQEGAEQVAERLAQYRINKVFFLVKGHSGTVCYPSKLAPNNRPGTDILQEMLDACHKRKLELHAWFVFNADSHWGKAHPEDAMFHVGRAEAWDRGPYSRKDDPEKIPICPLSRGYREHFNALVTEVLTRYQVDGVHLDYIRYGHLAYCFCPKHAAAAAQKGIQLEQVRAVIHKTLYAPDRNRDLYFSLYRERDANVSGWVNQREEEINQAVKELRALVKAKNPGLTLSAAFMPEGGEPDDTFALCHYAQNYATAGSQLDYILPMTYGHSPEWIARITLNAERKSSRPVYSGLWACEVPYGSWPQRSDAETPSTGTEAARAAGLRQSIQALRERGIKGFVLFRYGPAADRLWKELP